MSDKEEQIITKKKSDPDRESVFGHGFADIIDSYDWDETLRLVAEAGDEDVRRVLAKAERNRKALTPEEFAILISMELCKQRFLLPIYVKQCIERPILFRDKCVDLILSVTDNTQCH